MDGEPPRPEVTVSRLRKSVEGEKTNGMQSLHMRCLVRSALGPPASRALRSPISKDICAAVVTSERPASVDLGRHGGTSERA